MSDIKFSLAHPDGSDIGYYNTIKNTAPETRKYIDDIYFGAKFTYEHNGQQKSYGNVMDVFSNDEQIEDLLKIQKDFNIPVSLTMNQMTHPVEITTDIKVLKQFVEWIGRFYDKGIRTTTISNVHLIKSGILQSEFPEMKWKNTVNHQVRTAQEYIEYCEIGYDYIQLDRSLNRNLKELEKIKKVRDRYGKLTYMLIKEQCLPSCPFKTEHDSYNPELKGGNYFNLLSSLSCSTWRMMGNVVNGDFHSMPRVGNDAYWATEEIFHKYNDLVDVFKISGRYQKLRPGVEYNLSFSAFVNGRVVTLNTMEDVFKTGKIELFELGVVPIPAIIEKDNPEKVSKLLNHYFWGTKQGKALANKLLNCKNECYDCHQCERTFGLKEVDSLISVDKKNYTMEDVERNFKYSQQIFPLSVQY